jgi:uncharacterized protein
MDASRPYPAPTSPYVMHQSWHDLLFMHWRVDASALRRAVPDALPLALWEGSAYIGIVPFMMRDVRPRFLPAVPRLSFFPELNVRTYVTMDHRPGVYFFSLDAANPIAVELARSFFHLPYQNATMHCEADDTAVRFASTRTDRRGAPACFRASYRPTGDPFIAARDSLEYFLTARYCLYTTDPRGNVLSAEIHHPPWQLQPAEVEIETNTMTHQINLALPTAPPHLLFAKSMNMVTWLPRKVGTQRQK